MFDDMVKAWKLAFVSCVLTFSQELVFSKENKRKRKNKK